MKKSTLSAATLLALVAGLTGCRGEGNGALAEDAKSDPNRIHQPNKYVVSTGGKTSTSHHLTERAATTTDGEDARSTETDESGYPRYRNKEVATGGGSPKVPPVAPSSGNPKPPENKSNVAPAPDDQAAFKSRPGTGVTFQGVVMQPETAPINKLSVRPVETGVFHDGFSVRNPTPEQTATLARVLNATNKLRMEQNLPPLKINPDLTAYAMVRAWETAELFKAGRGFAHQRLDGSEVLREDVAGENLAMRQRSPEEAVESWRTSTKGHYQQMISPRYQDIGIGYAYDPQVGFVWVQLFGRHGAKSGYTFKESFAFDEKENRSPEMKKHDNIHQVIREAVKFDADGKMTLTGGQSTTNQTTQGYRTGKLKQDIYSAVRVYEQDGYKALIQDPQGNFSYQTFGEVVDPNHNISEFISIGKPTIPGDDVNFSAHYSGASLGAVNKDHVYADVNADVNFGEKKTMAIKFSNSKMGEEFTAAPQLDFSENLEWRNSQFQGHKIRADFYGPNGEEIGGTFSRPTGHGEYKGVFGLRKQ